MKLIVMANLLSAVLVSAAEPTDTAATAINSLGIDLLRRSGKADDNTLLSPYSIQSALAMTYAGAGGVTREEMARVLHYPRDAAELDRSFAALRTLLDGVVRESVTNSARMKQRGATNDPITLTVANRLFGQTGYDFRAPFLAVVRDNYAAPFEPLDFVGNPAGATKAINVWVEDQTRQRIRDLIPQGALNDLTRLVLVNAIYLKAPWMSLFPKDSTKSEPFHLGVASLAGVPTMRQEHRFGYAKRDGYSAVAVPYFGGDIQFLILLPDKSDGLRELEARLTGDMLAAAAKLPEQEVVLYLPKFKLEPPVFALGKTLQTLGMKSAFDLPMGSADFDGIAPRRRDNYLYISDIFHKTFLNLDEEGTEAAAATAVVMMAPTSIVLEKPKPVQVRVDHPFLFAVQERRSGACLFLGRVVDPR